MRGRLFALALAALLLVSCAGSNIPDSAFGPDILALQGKVDSFLGKLETIAGTAEGEYAVQAVVYQQLEEDIAGLRTRAAGIPGNAAALADLDAISENLMHLESLHRQGVSPAEVPVLRKLFGTQFNALYQSITGQPPLAGKE